MSKPDTFDRTELVVFQALGDAQRWTPDTSRCGGCDVVSFDIETSATDQVSLVLYDHGPEYGGLDLSLCMYPEEELAAATPQQMAATIARWLRDAAAKLEAAA